MKAILKSSHQEVARIDVENLGDVWCMAGNPNAEDLIKVISTDGKTVYWCDEIEFIDHTSLQNEIMRLRAKLRDFGCEL